MTPGFHAMRASLIARGLISAEGGRFALTEPGRAHVAATIALLRETNAPCDPGKARVRWNFVWRRCRGA